MVGRDNQAKITGHDVSPACARWIAAAMLLLSTAFAFVWSHLKPFWGDELLEFYSDARPSLGAVLSGQRHYPFSLEPPAFHLLLHLMQRLLPAHPELATRLPSIACLLITQLCVMRLTFRLTSDKRAALLAMALPFALVTTAFAPEARVYSLLTALFALALVAYEAVQRGEPSRRALLLLGLFAALSTAVLVHYYGIVLLAPFFAAEFLKALRSKRIDWAAWAALLGALALFLLNVPFLAALHEIQAHYYAAEAQWSVITFTYSWFFGRYAIFDHGHYGNTVRGLSLVMALLGLPLMTIVLLLRQRHAQRPPAVNAPVLTTLLGGLLLPFVNVALGHFVTHAYVARYSLPAVVAVAVLLALALAPYLRHTAAWIAVMALVLIGGCLQAKHDLDREVRFYAVAKTQQATTPELRDALSTATDPHLYIQDVARFLTMYFYATPEMKARIVGFQSPERELYWLHRTPASIFLRNMKCSTALPLTSFEELRAQPGPHLLVVYNDPAEEWIGKELHQPASPLRIEQLGHALGGRLLRVTFAGSPAVGVPRPSNWQCSKGR